MPHLKTFYAQQRILTWTVLVALVLRLAAVPWGMGLGPVEGFYHPDESKVWSSTFDFPRHFFSNPNLIYGTTLQYSIAVVLIPFRFLWNEISPLSTELSQIQFVIIGSRIVSCCLGAGCVGMAYRLGQQLGGKQTGMIAASLLSVSFYHCLNSALTTLDVAMSFFAISFIVLIWQAAQTGTRCDFILSGLAAGYLLGGKLSGVIFLIVPVVLTRELFRWRRNPVALQNAATQYPCISMGEWCRGLALCGGIASLILLISMPHIFLHIRAYLHFMGAQQHLWFDRSDHSLTGVLQRWNFALWTALGSLTYGLALIGLLLASLRVPERVRPLHYSLAAVLAGHIFFWRGYVPARFIIVLAPLLSVYAAYGVSCLLQSTSRWRRGLGAVLLVATMIEGLLMCLAGLYDRYYDTRTECAAFLIHTLQPTDRVALMQRTEKDFQKHAWRYPRVAEMKFQQVSILDSPDLILTSSFVTDMVQKALNSSELPDSYVWPQERAAFWPQYLVPRPEELRFAHQLFQGTAGYELIHTWRPTSLGGPEFGSPELKLYRKTR
jgi:hypothetical protein